MGLIFESLDDDAENAKKRHHGVEDEYEDEQNLVDADDYEEDDADTDTGTSDTVDASDVVDTEADASDIADAEMDASDVADTEVDASDVADVEVDASDVADPETDSYLDIYGEESIEPGTVATVKKKKGPHPAAIVVPLVLLVIIVGGYFVNRLYPLKQLFGGNTDKPPQQTIDDGKYADWTVMERVNIDGSKDFRLELPAGIGMNDISIENHYRDRALLIRIRNVSGDYFANASLKGNISDIAVAAWKVKDGEVLLSLQMDEIWEYEVSQENGTLVVNKYKAEAQYDALIVIDPVECAGLSEDVTALVAEAVAQKAAAEGIKVYVTRGNGGERSEAERLALIVDAEPVYFIELTAATDSDSSKYGMSAVYNNKYFDTECDNASVADILLKNIANAASNRANAIEDAADDSLLRLVQLPAAGLNIGYVSNTKECELLLNEGYRAKIAEGIVAGIRELLQAE